MASMATATEAPRVATLGPRDRCDRCDARAYYKMTMIHGELLFCAHEGRAALPKMNDLGATVLDETWQLDQ